MAKKVINLSMTIYPSHKEKLNRLCGEKETYSSLMRRLINEEYKKEFGRVPEEFLKIIELARESGFDTGNLLKKFSDEIRGEMLTSRKDNGAKRCYS